MSENTAARTRVMIVDDHEIVRRGIAEIVDRDEALEVVAEAGSVADAVRRADLVRPDVILVDLQLTKNINGADKGIAERKIATKKAKEMIDDEV